MFCILKIKKNKETSNEMNPAYINRHNSKCEKQIFFLMIQNKEGWHYIAVTKLSVLLRGITSKHNGDF